MKENVKTNVIWSDGMRQSRLCTQHAESRTKSAEQETALNLITWPTHGLGFRAQKDATIPHTVARLPVYSEGRLRRYTGGAPSSLPPCRVLGLLEACSTLFVSQTRGRDANFGDSGGRCAASTANCVFSTCRSCWRRRVYCRFIFKVEGLVLRPWGPLR